MEGDNGGAWKAWLITSFLNSCCWDDVWISSCCDSFDRRCCAFPSLYVHKLLYLSNCICFTLIFSQMWDKCSLAPQNDTISIWSWEVQSQQHLCTYWDFTTSLYIAHWGITFLLSFICINNVVCFFRFISALVSQGCGQRASFMALTKIHADGHWGISSFFSFLLAASQQRFLH